MSHRPIAHNVHLQVVVLDIEEHQCPIGHDNQERKENKALHEPRNAICKMLWVVFQ